VHSKTATQNIIKGIEVSPDFPIQVFRQLFFYLIIKSNQRIKIIAVQFNDLHDKNERLETFLFQALVC
jgi:hypothetical protein